MSCDSDKINVFQGDALYETYKWQDCDGNAFDLTNVTGDAPILQYGNLLHVFPLTLDYVDTESDNITFALTGAEVSTIAEGEYTIEFKINQSSKPVYIPQQGCIKLCVEPARTLP